MGSRCAKFSTGHTTGHGRGHESSMKKLVACVSQDNFSLSSEGEEEEEEEEEGEEEEGEEEEREEEEEALPVQGKLMKPEQQKQGVEDSSVAKQSPKTKQTHS